MYMIKNIFFDFDGVIADSVSVKTDAFYKLYESYGAETANKVVEHHKANGGMSRFEKFVYYHNNFLNKEIDEDGINELSAKFSELVKQGVIDAKEVDGSHEYILKNHNKYNMFVITGTPTDESIEICKSRGIYKYFKGIYGSPNKKDYWCNYILDKYKLKKEETIFVGDAMADYNAAIKASLKFYLREYDENITLFKEIENIERFSDFSDFIKLLKNK